MEDATVTKQAQQAQSDRRYIFCGIRNRGDGELRADKRMSTTAVYKLMQKSGDIAPHDARLNKGASVADTQFIAGHASTTLHYAQIRDAKEVKGRIPQPY